MTQLYDIIIEGQTIHKGVSEETFFDVMSDLSTAYYERGYPNPSDVSHTTYIKE